MYPRTVRVRSNNGTIHEYIRIVEAYRDDGHVKQRVVADLGRKDLLLEILPRLQQLLTGDFPIDPGESGVPHVVDASNWGAVLVVRALFEQLGLWSILDQHLGRAKRVPFADRAFVLVANRLIAPASEHGLATWLESDFVCDRQGRRFIPHWHQRRRVRVHPPNWMPGTARSINSARPKTKSKWRSTTASATCSVSSPIWCSTTSPVPPSKARDR